MLRLLKSTIHMILSVSQEVIKPAIHSTSTLLGPMWSGCSGSEPCRYAYSLGRIGGVYGLLRVNFREQSLLPRSYHVRPDDPHPICRCASMCPSYLLQRRDEPPELSGVQF
jgi:hypothetical protein